MKMDCSHPMAPDDEELLEFALDGEALTEEASRHLEHCETCQRRLAEYKDINASLVSHLYLPSISPVVKYSEKNLTTAIYTMYTYFRDQIKMALFDSGHIPCPYMQG